MLVIKRPDLHFGEFQRVEVAFPLQPRITDTVRIDPALKVEGIQVAVMTVDVPPGTFISQCT